MRWMFCALLLSSPAFAQEGDTVSFELQSGIIFLEGTINGKGPFTFIFDTGASVTVLRPQTAKKLGLPTKGWGIFGGDNSVKLDSFALGKAAVKDLSVAVMMVPQAELPLTLQGIKYDGIVGYPYLSQFVTTIDYRKKTIRLVPNEDAPAGGYVGFAPRELGADEANEIGIDGGVVVHKIAKGSPAEKGGLREGDIIQEIGGTSVDTVDGYYAVVKKSKPGDTITFSVIRDRKDVEVKVIVGAKK